MFVVEGIDKVKDIIARNRKRKSLNLEKISNNSIIEIGNISPLKLIELQANLSRIADAEKIIFVHGKRNKPELFISFLYKCGAPHSITIIAI